MPERLDLDVETGVYKLNDRHLLTRLLKKDTNDPNIKIENVEISKASKSGDNYMSQIQRVKIAAVSSDGTLVNKFFIMKVEDQADEKKSLLNTDKVWANEEFVYDSIIPRLEELSNSSIASPKYYYGDDKMILLEDLDESGHRMGDRAKGLNLDHTLLVMDKLAQFHAASFAYRYKNRPEFEKLMFYYNHPWSSSENAISMAPYIRKSILDAIDLVKAHKYPEDAYESVFKVLRDFIEKEDKAIVQFEMCPEEDSVVFVHGDLWGNNIMFLYDNETSTPIDAKFLDFQGTRPGSVCKDLLYFIFLSVEPSVRTENFDKIIEFYHSKLGEHMRQCLPSKDPYVNAFTYEKFLNQFLQYKLYGLVNAIILLPMIVLDTKTGTYDFLNSNGANQQLIYRERLCGIIDEYLKRGWIDID
ncbi:uncharacterized protein LOC143916614 [Arctopsyche grandis]|uniref:uncharacterized protein LOC143916614 n=1 Tax=Arctopsyche grandis TaxID=121162 RepID=UPI00406D9875